MARLFWGEYEPKDQSLTIGNARIAFLNAVHIHAPQVLEDLDKYHYTIFKSLDRPPHLQWWQIKYERYYAELRECFLSWASAWHLTPEWCLENAVKTILYWRSFPSEYEKLNWYQGDGGWMVPTNEAERVFVFEHTGWEPTYDSRAKIKKNIEQDFKRQLEDYLERMEALVEGRGYVKVKRKNKPDHFEWLACFQVAEMSYEKIREKFDLNYSQAQTYLSDDTKAIRKAINDLASFIDLPLRKEGTAPGRRRKK